MTANQVQIRRDSNANLNASTPATGELGYDTTNKRLRLGDGSTAGGILVPNSIDVQGQNFIAAAASGTNTITMTVAPAPAAYATYQRFVFKAAADNTASATINVNSLGAKTIKKRTTAGIADLTGGEIQQDGVYAVVYDGTYMQLEDYTRAESGSDYELLGTATASSSATLDFTSMITSTYDHYVFVCENLRPATNQVELWIRTSTNNGSTYSAGASDYSWNSEVNASSAAGAYSTNDIADSEISVNGTDLNGSNGNGAAGGMVSLIVNLVNPLGTTQNKLITYEGGCVSSAGASIHIKGSGFRLSTADIDAVRFMMSSGNITSGKIYLYGVKNA